MGARGCGTLSNAHGRQIIRSGGSTEKRKQMRGGEQQPQRKRSGKKKRAWKLPVATEREKASTTDSREKKRGGTRTREKGL